MYYFYTNEKERITPWQIKEKQSKYNLILILKFKKQYVSRAIFYKQQYCREQNYSWQIDGMITYIDDRGLKLNKEFQWLGPGNQECLCIIKPYNSEKPQCTHKHLNWTDND